MANSVPTPEHPFFNRIATSIVYLYSLQGDYIPVVADFGLVSIMHEEDSNYAPGSPRTMFRKRNSVVGSAYWMAPEMLKRNIFRIAFFSNLKCCLITFTRLQLIKQQRYWIAN